MANNYDDLRKEINRNQSWTTSQKKTLRDIVQVLDVADGTPAPGIEPDLPPYDNTVWVDVDGDATVDGTNPGLPTTFTNAMANVAFSTNIVLAEGTYSTGADINLTQSNVTITGIQGGTGSNSCIISDNIILGSGITRFRAHGIRFDGAISDNGSDGRHYFSWCSLGSTGSFTRNSPNRWCDFFECDLSSGSFSIQGGGGNNAATTVTGSASATGVKTLDASAHTTQLFNNGVSAGVVMTDGTLVVEESSIVGGVLAIDAGPLTSVRLHNSHVLNDSGAPQSVRLQGNYSCQNTVFDYDTSVLTGTPSTGETSYWTGELQAANHWDTWEFSESGDWTAGNFLSTCGNSTLHARFAPRTIEFFEFEFFNDTTLTSATEVELVRNPFGTPTVLETMQFNGNAGSIITFTPVRVNKYDVVGIRLKTAGETPSNMYMGLRFRVID